LFYFFLKYDFLKYALGSSLIIAIISPIIGTYLVLRRFSLVADALSHTAFSGTAIGFLLQNKKVITFSPIYFGLLFSILGSLFINKIKKMYFSFREISIPVLVSFSVSLSVVVLSYFKGTTVDLYSLLFGSILMLGKIEFLIIAFIGFLVLSLFFLFYKEMFLITFDEEYAFVAGVNTSLIDTFFMILSSLVIAILMNSVGVLLVSSLITVPVATSLILSQSFRSTILYSILFSLIAMFIGIICSYYFDLAASGSIVFVSILEFFFVYFFSTIFKKFLKKGML